MASATCTSRCFLIFAQMLHMCMHESAIRVKCVCKLQVECCEHHQGCHSPSTDEGEEEWADPEDVEAYHQQANRNSTSSAGKNDLCRTYCSCSCVENPTYTRREDTEWCRYENRAHTHAHRATVTRKTNKQRRCSREMCLIPCPNHFVCGAKERPRCVLPTQL